jgi:hypothetical protein
MVVFIQSQKGKSKIQGWSLEEYSGVREGVQMSPVCIRFSHLCPFLPSFLYSGMRENKKKEQFFHLKNFFS